LSQGITVGAKRGPEPRLYPISRTQIRRHICARGRYDEPNTSGGLSKVVNFPSDGQTANLTRNDASRQGHPGLLTGRAPTFMGVRCSGTGTISEDGETVVDEVYSTLVALKMPVLIGQCHNAKSSQHVLSSTPPTERLKS
jgi:hypothetical protein